MAASKPISSLLEDHGIKRAIVIDDGYNAIPLPSRDDKRLFLGALAAGGSAELPEEYAAKSPGEWQGMLDDRQRLTQLYSSTDIPEALHTRLFGRARTHRETALAGLEPVTKWLDETGLEIEKHGADDAVQFDSEALYFVDLVLTQELPSSDEMIEAIKTKLQEIRPAEANEAFPLSVLISDHNTLFKSLALLRRGDQWLAGGRFIGIAKEDFARCPALTEVRIRSLVEHSEVAAKVNVGLPLLREAAENALREAVERLSELDVPELSLLSTRLLEAEGQPLGGYLVEVLGLYISHKIEKTYQDFQFLDALGGELSTVARYQFHPERVLEDFFEAAISVPAQALGASGDHLKFGELRLGDILMSTKADSKSFWLVLVQDCDIMRDKTDVFICVIGQVVDDVDVQTGALPSYCFPLTIGPDRWWIQWDIGQWTAKSTAQWSQIRKSWMRVGRLRSPWSLEIQTAFFSSQIRVASLASPPRLNTYVADVYIRTPTGNLQVCSSDSQPGAFVSVGRKKGSKQTQEFVLCAPFVDKMVRALSTLLNDGNVGPAQESIVRKICFNGDYLSNNICAEKKISGKEDVKSFPNEVKVFFSSRADITNDVDTTFTDNTKVQLVIACVDRK